MKNVVKSKDMKKKVIYLKLLHSDELSFKFSFFY